MQYSELRELEDLSQFIFAKNVLRGKNERLFLIPLQHRLQEGQQALMLTS